MPNISLLNSCNLKCPYCFADDMVQEKKYFINKEQLQKIIILLKNSGIKYAGLIGGEPTLHPKLIELVDQLYTNGIDQLNIFSNGILLGEYVKLFEKYDVHCLINLNSPDIIGKDKYQQIKTSIQKIDAVGKIDNIKFGITLYDGMPNDDYLFEMLERYKCEIVRCSYATPTHKITYKDKDDYYTRGKELFLNFLRKCRINNVEASFDCNIVPLCYYSNEELKVFNQKQLNYCKRCSPVIDILPNYTATPCFGIYDPIPLDNFETLQQFEYYCIAKKNIPKQLKNISPKCEKCKFFNNLSCQGGCLSFAQE